jgi:hypothetical protein
LAISHLTVTLEMMSEKPQIIFFYRRVTEYSSLPALNLSGLIILGKVR